jgi:hypothetical protein
MNSLYNYLQKCNDFLGKITIDQAFIDYRNQMKWKFKANGRDENTRLMHADCLILEYAMIQSAFATESYCKEFDYEVRMYNAKVDAKIFDQWFNISLDKLKWYLMNIEKGLLTHFAFYRWVNKPTKPLEVGDVVQLELIQVRSAAELMERLEDGSFKNLSTSQYDGYYYTPRKK